MTLSVCVLSDAVILNSLCKIFGLLDSVKQALDLKQSQDEENKFPNNIYGEKNVECNIWYIQ